MSTTSAFTIYNASAGSGKTFAVVINYLKLLFQSKNPLVFKTILALTFTNKAVGEMKERVIAALKEFSDEAILNKPNSMFTTLLEDLKVEPEILHKKARLILKTIVHNYAAFDISTIDKFNHRLIRTFAYDLKLPINFEVELDAIEMLNKAVDKLIDKAGTNDELTKALVDFAIEKADDDKSWDIAYDLNSIAVLLIKESEISYINSIKNKSLDDFKSLKSVVINNINVCEKEIVKNAESVLELIEKNGLNHDDFSRKTLPNHFIKAQHLDLNGIYNNQLENNIRENKKIYNVSLDHDKVNTIDHLLPQIETSYLTIKKLVYNQKFLKNAYKNINALSVLNEINKTLQELKEDENKLLISEFNTIISEEINKQPVPYIYERLGEKFKHYFIDEFQDTSELQWNNLIPLIDNALSGESLKGDRGSAMLVGDAKQAIYRWRGGKAEQFIGLYNKENPFFVKKSIENLPINYRSARSIVNFNNSFFKHISSFAFSNPEYQSLFENSEQKVSLEHEGYVEFTFLEIDKEEKELLHCEKVFEKIKKALANGFQLGDICIITRKIKEGIAIAEFLTEKNIDIVSSETLMLKNSAEVNFIIALLTLVEQPKNNQIKIEFLTYLTDYLLKVEDYHEFYKTHVHLDTNKLFKALESFGYNFNLEDFIQLSLYESVESIIRTFNLDQKSSAYIQFFLDEVLEYSLQNYTDIAGFLTFWERKKDRLSITSPHSEKAVQIMTIHKSKGLEFPVVIFPYANQDIYFDMSPKVWVPVNENEFNDFSHLYVDLNKDLEEYGDLGLTIYNDYRSTLELDNINLLYVVLTRAIEQLYIISELDVDKDDNEKLGLYSGLLIHFLKATQKWNNNQLEYIFGNPKTTFPKKEKGQVPIQNKCISISREEHKLNILTNAGYLWDTSQEKAIEKGNLIHLIMSQINTISDIDYVLDNFIGSGKINKNQFIELKPIINGIVNHAQLKNYFNSDLTIYNEKDIITQNGDMLRPDRIVVNKSNQAIIIDYKTGIDDLKHMQQLQSYQKVLEDMNFEVVKKILVYVNDAIHIKEF
jgi:ATP-dependent exoDNAse (exonuclease V) beta subunit